MISVAQTWRRICIWACTDRLRGHPSRLAQRYWREDSGIPSLRKFYRVRKRSRLNSLLFVIFRKLDKLLGVVQQLTPQGMVLFLACLTIVLADKAIAVRLDLLCQVRNALEDQHKVALLHHRLLQRRDDLIDEFLQLVRVRLGE